MANIDHGFNYHAFDQDSFVQTRVNIHYNDCHGTNAVICNVAPKEVDISYHDLKPCKNKETGEKYTAFQFSSAFVYLHDEEDCRGFIITAGFFKEQYKTL